MAPWTYILVALLISAAKFLPRASAIVLLVEHKECIVDRVEAGEQMKGSFVVVDADSAWVTEESISSVDFEIEGPHNTKVYSAKRKAEEQFSFRALYAGDYKLCVSNVDHMAVTVELNYAIGHHHHTQAQKKPADAAKDEDMGLAEAQVEAVRDALLEIQQEQAYFKARDQRRKKTLINTTWRLFWYGLLELLVIALSAAVQVSVLRFLFERKAKKRFAF